jgi:hypothetical protein
MMPAETRSMAQRRMDGHSWSDIASSMGGTADGRRMQYQREIDRVADVLDVRPVGG